MAKTIQLSSGDLHLRIRLRDTATARAIYQALPIEASFQTWGEEIDFPVPVDVPRETDARDVVEPGEIAFWVEGRSIAIGFGPTPISRGDEIRLAAATNIWGDSLDDVKQLGQLRSGDRVSLWVG